MLAKMLNEKFHEMFPLLAKEVEYYTFSGGALKLYSRGNHRRLLYIFTYKSDSEWTLERI